MGREDAVELEAGDAQQPAGAGSAAGDFAGLAEASRQAGDAVGAEHVARQGLRLRPDDVPGRLALALALLTQGRESEAQQEVEQALASARRGGRAGAPPSWSPPPPPVAAEPLGPMDEIDELDFDRAFEGAEADATEMVDANRVAEEAMRDAALDAPEGLLPGPDSPLATRTMAELLEKQGHVESAEALRAAIDARRSPPRGTAPSPAQMERQRVIATLERWLENLRGGRA